MSENVNPFCENHADQAIESICVSPGCFKFVCHRCYKPHTQQHQTKKVFPEFSSLDEVVETCVTTLNELLSKASKESYAKEESVKDRLHEQLNQARKVCLKTVNDYFDEMVDKADNYLVECGVQTPEHAMSQWQAYTDELTEKLKSISNGDVNEGSLKQVYTGAETNHYSKIRQKIFEEVEHVKCTLSGSLETNIEKVLKDTVSVTKAGDYQFVLPPEKRHADYQITQTDKITIKKMGPGDGTCIGAALPKNAISEWKVTLVQVTSGMAGWACIGVTNIDTLNLSASNYSTASCLCSDQFCYNMTVSNKPPIVMGNTYTIRVDYPANIVQFTGEDGFSGVLVGIENITLYPFFDFKNTNEVTVSDFKVIC